MTQTGSEEIEDEAQLAESSSHACLAQNAEVSKHINTADCALAQAACECECETEAMPRLNFSNFFSADGSDNMA
eukprot:CAMPEP_0185596998 /NCGR_PEP_ID=MMETSP0434-20130131/81087_1 /TAXON_ID=626734 ORGANISM="Favella taraikaensis, Strain Fe Narragansett Bay" /NCGR_SAMPLE_ID=MMETSP0434 /ASSEMBLY_ACC=CAM_ASM_000379 /LENGTH=73 /DNA_ID=CAMNT_0028225601 /DNA_START=767 /DNA_END=988 /DNA_ORIENTATION=-